MSKASSIAKLVKNTERAGLFVTKEAKNAKSLFKVGLPKLVKYAGTGAAAVGVAAAGTHLAASQLGKAAEAIGIKQPSYADQVTASAKAMNKMLDAQKAQFDEAIRRQQVINNTPTVYGGLGTYGTPELTGLDYLNRMGLSPSLPTLTSQADSNNSKASFPWTTVIIVVLAGAAAFFFLRR